MKIKLILVGLGFLISTAALSKPATPEAITGGTLVDAKAAKAAIDGGATPVDVRKKLEYAEEHIKGAISLSYKEKSAKKPDYDAGKDKFKEGKLKPNPKGYVFYCNGNKCWKSFKASTWAIKKGIKNVYWLRGGIPEWKAAGLPTEK